MSIGAMVSCYLYWHLALLVIAFVILTLDVMKRFKNQDGADYKSIE
ncbi:hypothetical protein QUF79_01135 [Fictibacillus enclensis]|nr:hypothetical protein [Fictibacillus enclensis]MDM5196690.1 hypothetical protein [Fictibacillus enclensis]